MKQVTTFFLGDTFCGVDILRAKEINDQMKFTPVPDSPDYVKGLLNLRGEIITIFDLGKRLGRKQTEIKDNTRNLIIKTDNAANDLIESGQLTDSIGNDAFGFIVDKIGDVVSLNNKHIKPAPANVGNIAGKYIYGVVELENQLLVIFNLEELVN
ncbi:MAG: chemotaxis protein CheW [Candidatus Cloacimonadota bacterium]|nr:chemotaxis protein CheW [Candidatus Cloacimonadota bacterium]